MGPLQICVSAQIGHLKMLSQGMNGGWQPPLTLADPAVPQDTHAGGFSS